MVLGSSPVAVTSLIILFLLHLAYKATTKTTNQVKATPGSYKTSIDTSPPPKSLLLHCKQIHKVKNELDGQPSGLLASMHVSNYTFSPMHLVLLELDTHRPHLDFKILDENNNEVIPRTFYLQLLNKQ